MAEILIIDDEPQIRRLLVRVLNGAGHRVCEATNGRDGIELFHRAHPALVITDIVMPNQEGIETILTLRRDDRPVKIIAMSGHDQEMLETARLIGADDIIEKPFRAHDLLNRVRALSTAPLASP